MTAIERLVNAMGLPNLECAGKFSIDNLNFQIQNALEYINASAYTVTVLLEKDYEAFHVPSENQQNIPRDICYWCLGAMQVFGTKKTPIVIKGDNGKKFGFYFG